MNLAFLAVRDLQWQTLLVTWISALSLRVLQQSFLLCRNQNLGMVADAESSDSMAGSSSSAAEKHVDRLVFSYLSSWIHFHLLSDRSYLAL